MIMQTGNIGIDILTILLMLIPGLGFVWIIGDWGLLLNFWVEYGLLALVATGIVVAVIIIGIILIVVPEFLVTKIFGIILIVQAGIVGVGLTIGFFGFLFGGLVLSIIGGIFGAIGIAHKVKNSKCDCIGQPNCECT